jgi:hypothetical protein
MFERQPDSKYSRFLQETKFLFKVPRWMYAEYVRRMDPKLAIDIPVMCVRHADILQLTDTQQADLHTLVAAIPDTTEIRREVNLLGEPRLRVLRQYLRHNIETETRYAPVNPGLLGMRIRVRQFEKDGFDITALYTGELPSANAVRDTFTHFQTHHLRYMTDVVQVPGDHISYDLLEGDAPSGVQGTWYHHVHVVGNFGVINSEKDVFLPDSAAR